LSRWQGAIATLQQAQRRGTVLAIGLSTHNPRYVREAITSGVMDCVFVTLNVAGTWVEGQGGNEAMIQACHKAERAGLGVVILKVLGNGGLASQKARALRWAVRQRFADGVIVGVETVSQLQEDAAYFSSKSP
jgi:aryl-alcohol dehydrogenase-like predicted oxidoreductase